MEEIKYFGLAKSKSTFKSAMKGKSGKEVGLFCFFFYVVMELQCVINFLI